MIKKTAVKTDYVLPALDRDILDQVPFGVYVINKQGIIEYLNQVMVAMSGAENAEEIVGLNALTLPTYRKYGLTKYFRQGLSGKPFRIESIKYTSYTGKKTTYRHYSGIPIKDKSGQIKKLLCIVEDITTAKQKAEELDKNLKTVTEQNKSLSTSKKAFMNILEDLDNERTELQKAKVKDDAILENIGDGLIVVDRSEKVIMINKTARQMIELEEKVIGKDINKIARLKDESGELVPVEQQVLSMVLKHGKKIESDKYSFSYKQEKKRFPVGLTVSPVILDEQIIGAVMVFRDITELKKVDRMKTEFVSLAAHQLRTPLSTIKWYIEMLLAGDAGDMNKEQHDYSQEIYNSSNRLVKLINDFLNLSRLESGRLKIELQAASLEALVESILKELEQMAKRKKCSIVFKEPKTKLPEFLIDPSLIQQVFGNIVTNAIQYSKPGKNCVILVEISKEKSYYIISVKDKGIGIPKAAQKRIFEKFFRAEEAVEMEARGSGLGLYIAKLIIEEAGGKIWFESERGKGTTFYFSIPIKGMKGKKGEKGLA